VSAAVGVSPVGSAGSGVNWVGTSSSSATRELTRETYHAGARKRRREAAAGAHLVPIRQPRGLTSPHGGRLLSAMAGPARTGLRRPPRAHILVLAALAAPWAAAAPAIEHSPPAGTGAGDLAIRARIDAGGAVMEPFLFWRVAGRRDYNRVPLRPLANGRFEAAVPRTALPADCEAVEYYLQAFDADLTEGVWHSKNAPYRLRLKAAGPARRSFSLDSDPPGATLDLDGQTVGSTPFQGRLAPGRHSFVMRRPGYLDHEQQVNLPADRDVSLTIVLDRAAPHAVPGRLAIASDPAGAELILDGSASGTTPADLDVEPGEHAVLVRLAGFRAATERVADAPGARAERSYALVALAVRTSVETEPPGALLTADGQPAGRSPVVLTLSPGRHEIAASMPGYLASSQTATVAAGTEETVRLTLRRDGATLRIATTPPGAAIRLDGEGAGTAPLTVEADSGRHVVSASREGYDVAEKSVVVEAGKDADVRVDLVAAPSAPIRPAAAPAVGEIPPAEHPAAPSPAVVPAPPEGPSPLRAFAAHAASRARWWWAAGAVALAAACAGTYYALDSRDARSRLEALQAPSPDTQVMADRLQSSAFAANVLFGGAAVAAAGGVVLFVWSTP